MNILQRIHEKNQVTELRFFDEQFANNQDNKLANNLLPKINLRSFEDLFTQGKLTPNLNEILDNFDNLIEDPKKNQSSKNLFHLSESNYKVYKCKFCHKIFTKGCSLGIF